MEWYPGRNPVEIPDYRVTGFKCETCEHRLYRVWPSNLLVCTNWECDADGEPLFLVGES